VPCPTALSQKPLLTDGVIFCRIECATKFVTKTQKVVTKCENDEMRRSKTLRKSMVGVTGFEPATSTSQTDRNDVNVLALARTSPKWKLVVPGAHRPCVQIAGLGDETGQPPGVSRLAAHHPIRAGHSPCTVGHSAEATTFSARRCAPRTNFSTGAPGGLVARGGGIHQLL
jgi:hypothetical protein